MANYLDIDRIMRERIMDEGTLPTAHVKLLTRLKEELRGEMVGIVQKRAGLKDVEAWLRGKSDYFYKILENETIEPATQLYKIIKQIADEAIHFVAEYRIAINYEKKGGGKICLIAGS